MLSAILLPRHWRLNTNDSDGSTCSGSHKRFTKRLLHFHRHKRNEPDVKDIDAKQPCAATSLIGNDDDRSIHHEARGRTCNSLVLLCNSSYPKANILSRARLHIQQNVLSLHRGYLGTLGLSLRVPFLIDPVPKLRIGTFSSDHRGATKGGPSQKRPPGSPGKSPADSTCKKQCRGSKNSDKTQNDRGSDDKEGKDKHRKRRKRRKEKDGPRFPWPEDSADRKRFLCPFYKAQPDRYCPCKGLRITSISYVTQHIGRCHVLNHVTLGAQGTGQSTNDNPTVPRTTTDPDEIVIYCPICRIEFYGPGADNRWDSHKNTGCVAQSIAQTGVLLPGEFQKLKLAVAAVSGDHEKWKKIWTACFPRESTPSQYNGAEITDTVASIGDGSQPQMLYQGSANEIRHPNHDPLQVLAPQTPDYTDTQDSSVLFNFFTDPWDMPHNIGNLGYATSDIPNPAPTGLGMTRTGWHDPGLMQPVTTAAQNHTFASDDWGTNNYNGTR
ncbi:uncharacterized protein FFB20_10442 [Fusarium fujikuroi]|uniref:Uncharacterized protein n=2 Tax=Fusarium fujikuroi TaxID=5127 RepID=S0EBY0_GIBF5|nr:uncharacterized protein FFUJ_13875 [Fusarium fujikuroi IMI 58289]KLO93612.1 uncharacterized protein Y057_12181 [Fusarium fujikuroi]QGI67767.1 hypothetical protein CEK27_011738 [Fusarium fujikuroi]QGI85001.1 hypothetical protein CEK25_011730 [Fusarium fujikuroi]QGI98652.1 hypothetical protein CEK26_011721 [Fusarium fujikuroi]CCT72125.1 uncharacterized protein FFUJ_13875 [Fusarium fujikuroi IMI 58289]